MRVPNVRRRSWKRTGRSAACRAAAWKRLRSFAGRARRRFGGGRRRGRPGFGNVTARCAGSRSGWDTATTAPPRSTPTTPPTRARAPTTPPRPSARLDIDRRDRTAERRSIRPAYGLQFATVRREHTIASWLSAPLPTHGPLRRLRRHDPRLRRHRPLRARLRRRDATNTPPPPTTPTSATTST